MNTLACCTANLNVVLTGYGLTSDNDEHIESISDLGIKFETVATTKTVPSGQSFGTEHLGQCQ